MRRFLAGLILALAAGCVDSPTAPPLLEGEYRLEQANGVAMPGSLSFSDGVTFTYHSGTHLRIEDGRRYVMVLDYTARDDHSATPWMWELSGEYELRGDTLVLDPRGGDWNGQRVLVDDGGRLVFQFAAPNQRLREMVFRQQE